jgi:hypothetical protein
LSFTIYYLFTYLTILQFIKGEGQIEKLIKLRNQL